MKIKHCRKVHGLSGSEMDCDGVSRRGFLQIGALAGLGITLPMAIAARRSQGASARDVNCILIWTRGGTSHHDTFDPKPDAPASVRGEFGVIDTAVPGVHFSEICPRMAQELKRFAVLRGWNPQNGSHGHADQWVMSGRRFNPAIAYPCYGSVVSYYHGFRSALPPFVQLGDQIDRRFGGGSPGILGMEYGAFEVLADPNSKDFSVRDITPAGGLTLERVSRRREFLGKLDQLRRHVDRQPKLYDVLDEHYKAAFDMITAPETQRAFALEEEDPKLRDAYGRHRFGQSCLLARRLIEHGVRFVTVTDGGWDTHQNNFKSLKDSRMPPVDQAFPQLLIDLEQRGLLESTLVLWLTDFGRTPTVNSASGRDHWATAGFAIFAGAGVPGGAVLGETDDEGGTVVRDQYTTDDIAHTVYMKLGIPTDLVVHSPDGRPVRLIEGRPIVEFF
ncbi:MAG: hypothetical protein KatS3mg110_1504 [Pirellulaceae bacterium]|nr:MAG: hypothetical protein KatS3mg110_1504 [Pirellulaceae bacterium]